jgi:prepilin-type N-terminal cleavage/methylation domain-containing protein
MRARGAAGFTLLEVLIAMAIVAIAVFPALQLVNEAQKDTHDAKFSALCSGRMRSLLSEITRSAKPGQNGSGDFSSMSDEEGFDQRFAYANIKYEWQCQSADLSLDVTPAADLSRRREGEQNNRKKKQEQEKEAEDQDAGIDGRFRARYVRMTCTYNLEDGEEKIMVVETYLPPLPTQDQLKKDKDGRTFIDPNKGTGGTAARTTRTRSEPRRGSRTFNGGVR